MPALWASKGRHPISCTPGVPAPRTSLRSAGTRRGAPTSEPLTLNQRGGTVTHGPGGETEAQSMCAPSSHPAGQPPTVPLRTGGDQAQGPSGMGTRSWGRSLPLSPGAPVWPRLSWPGGPCSRPAGDFPGTSPHPAPSTGGFRFPSRLWAGRLAMVSGDRPGLAVPWAVRWAVVRSPGGATSPGRGRAPPAPGRGCAGDLVITRVPSVRPAARLRNTAAAHLNSNYPTRPCQP